MPAGHFSTFWLKKHFLPSKLPKFCYGFPRFFDDTQTCWHGSGVYEDCNNVLWSRNLMIRYKGSNCKWWHFYPYETYAELRSKFEEIMSGKFFIL